MITNHNNDAHIIDIVTRSSRDIGKDVDANEYSNDKGSDEQENEKKWLKNSEDKVDSNALRLDETLIILLSQIKISLIPQKDK